MSLPVYAFSIAGVVVAVVVATFTVLIIREIRRIW